MRAELKRIHQRLGITTIYVTHDQVEAMTLGDRIVVMSNGRVQQIGAPQEVYREPRNLFVAGFIGSPPMNLLRGRADDDRLVVGDLSLPLPASTPTDVAVGLRPEDLAPANGSGDALAFSVEVVEPLGSEVVVHGTILGDAVESGADEEIAELPIAVGGEGAPRPADEPRPGDTVHLTVSPDRVHLFDLRTGLALRP
jgi:multiple sugar transport system ATP-binding protein